MRFVVSVRRHAVGLACASGMLAGAVQAQVLVESQFDSGPDGWTGVSFTSFCTEPVSPTPITPPAWIDDGGVPGGYIQLLDFGALSFTPYFCAPASFHGDLGAAYGGSLTLELRYFHPGDDIFYAADDIYLLGAGITLIADIPNPSRDSWGVASVPLVAGAWRVGSCSGPAVTEAELRSVLADVQELYIRAEHASGDDRLDLDRVTIDATPVIVGCEAVWDEQDDAEPTGRWRHAVAIDTDRDVLVLFGGDTGETDTWEYDLAARVWTRTEPLVTPRRRGGHAMVYDAARRKIVMTGGAYLNRRYNEVWEYDTATDQWSEAAPMDVARSGHSMAYDSTRDTIVLYGGLDASAAGATETLERTAIDDAWLARASAINPGAQVGYAMAYDAVRGKSVLIGSGTVSVSVAEWDGAAGTWDLRSFSGTVPGERRNPTVVYDAGRSAIVLMGGEGASSVWDYDGQAWTQRANINPGGRDEHAAAYDPARGRVLLSGGILNSHTPQRDLLAFDGSANTWTTEWSRSAMGARELFGMVYDEIGEQAVAYGGVLLERAGLSDRYGSGTFAFRNDTWSFLATTGAVGTRFLMPLVYNPENRTALLYGGRTGAGAGSTSGRIWELDLATLVWTDRTTLTPGPRADHAAVWDRARSRMVVHGGVDDVSARLSDTWLYDPATQTWTTLAPGAVTPGPRSGAGFAYDEHRGVMVVFGGHVGPAAAYDNQTWEWDGTAWTNATPAFGNPPARLRPLMVYDPERRTVLMYGGRTNFNASTDINETARPYEDVWEWNGTAWSNIAVGSAIPTALIGSASVYDEARNRVLHFGGVSVTNGTFRNGQSWDLVTPPGDCGSECPADLSSPGSPGIPDGLLSGADFFEFLTRFGAGDLSVDFSSPANPGQGDGLLSGADFFEFLNLFAQGC